MSINQKEGVYQVVKSVVSENGLTHEVGQNAKEILGKVGVKKVHELVCGLIMSREIDMTEEGRAKYQTEKDMLGYARGLVTNWLNKDTRLNGGEKYVTKNPGSREGASDEVLKELKKLRAMKEGDADALEMIDAAIESRKTEIKAANAPKVEIDVSKLPAGLQHLVGE